MAAHHAANRPIVVLDHADFRFWSQELEKNQLERDLGDFELERGRSSWVSSCAKQAVCSRTFTHSNALACC